MVLEWGFVFPLRNASSRTNPVVDNCYFYSENILHPGCR